ncbi:MAG: hypothetical protein AAGG11_10850 [Pseudomonadota bacterium]
MARMGVVLLLGLWAALARGGTAAPLLFDRINAEPLRVELAAPLQAIARDSDPEPESRPGTLTLLDSEERFAVALKPRGKSRRKRSNCSFPPLWVEMKKADVKGTSLAGHHRRKLVTHCEALTRRGRDSSKVWIEMLAYRALNLLTDYSFRVQPLRITYRDTARPEKTFDHPGFLIEHKRELARRLDLRPVDGNRLSLSTLAPTHASLVTLFNLLIGNADFSILQGPPGDDCCHNSVPLMAADGSTYSIIYDFDNTGLVNPRYAMPSEALRMRSVKKRVYRGYCRHNPELAANLAAFAGRQAAIEALFSEHPEISRAEKKRIGRYLQQFFNTYTLDLSQRSRLERACLG